MIIRKFSPLGVYLCFAGVLRAESFIDTLLAANRDTAMRINAQIPGWWTAWGWNLGFMIAIGVLGLIITALQMLTKKDDSAAGATPRGPLEWAVIVLGIVVGGLTLAVNLAFAADHREYRKSITDATQAIGHVEEESRRLRGSPDVRAYQRLEALDVRTEKQEEEFRRFRTLVDTQHAATVGKLVSELEDIETNLTSWMPSLVGEQVAYASVGGLTVEAIGEANDPWQAEQNAYTAATEQMLIMLVKSSGLKLVEGERESLRAFVTQYGRKQAERQKTAGVRVRVMARLSISPSYEKPAFITSYLRSQKLSKATLQQEIVRLRELTRGKSGDIGFLETEGTIAAGKGGSIRLQAPNASDGSFLFTFSALARSDGIDLHLDSLAIDQDSSAGSTRWRFYVRQDERLLISLPEQRWDDSKRPTISYWDSRNLPAASATAVNGTIRVTIVAIKPKLQL